MFQWSKKLPSKWFNFQISDFSTKGEGIAGRAVKVIQHVTASVAGVVFYQCMVLEMSRRLFFYFSTSPYFQDPTNCSYKHWNLYPESFCGCWCLLSIFYQNIPKTLFFFFFFLFFNSILLLRPNQLYKHWILYPENMVMVYHKPYNCRNPKTK